MYVTPTYTGGTHRAASRRELESPRRGSPLKWRDPKNNRNLSQNGNGVSMVMMMMMRMAMMTKMQKDKARQI